MPIWPVVAGWIETLWKAGVCARALADAMTLRRLCVDFANLIN
jgi:hypothetical protein